jgi:hypothetical protein
MPAEGGERRFINSYNSLFYMAFFKRLDVGCVNGSVCARGPHGEARLRAALRADCLLELSQQLGTIFLTAILINNALAVLIPCVRTHAACPQDAGSQSPCVTAPPPPSLPLPARSKVQNWLAARANAVEFAPDTEESGAHTGAVWVARCDPDGRAQPMRT